MVNDLPIQYRNDEIERNAYNAAFYELGFRWHWDSHTYYELLSQSQHEAERIRHYLKTHQPHLLKPTSLISSSKSSGRRRPNTCSAALRPAR